MIISTRSVQTKFSQLFVLCARCLQRRTGTCQERQISNEEDADTASQQPSNKPHKKQQQQQQQQVVPAESKDNKDDAWGESPDKSSKAKKQIAGDPAASDKDEPGATESVQKGKKPKKSSSVEIGDTAEHHVLVTVDQQEVSSGHKPQQPPAASGGDNDSGSARKRKQKQQQEEKEGDSREEHSESDMPADSKHKRGDKSRGDKSRNDKTRSDKPRSDKERHKPSKMGAVHHVDVAHPRLKVVAASGLAAYNKSAPDADQLALVEIVSATRKTVEGQLFVLTVRACAGKGSGETNLYKLQVQHRPWAEPQYMLISMEPVSESDAPEAEDGSSNRARAPADKLVDNTKADSAAIDTAAVKQQQQPVVLQRSVSAAAAAPVTGGSDVSPLLENAAERLSSAVNSSGELLDGSSSGSKLQQQSTVLRVLFMSALLVCAVAAAVCTKVLEKRSSDKRLKQLRRKSSHKMTHLPSMPTTPAAASALYDAELGRVVRSNSSSSGVQ
jgi:Cystatin domain